MTSLIIDVPFLKIKQYTEMKLVLICLDSDIFYCQVNLILLHILITLSSVVYNILVKYWFILIPT
jgi:hypothetical protein